jgi:hypothetical protein
MSPGFERSLVLVMEMSSGDSMVIGRAGGGARSIGEGIEGPVRGQIEAFALGGVEYMDGSWGLSLPGSKAVVGRGMSS